MDRDRFEEIVEQALAQLPEKFRSRLTNVAILIEDRPAEPSDDHTLLLGLFHGVPLTEKSVFYAGFPDQIILYQKNIEAVSGNDRELRRQVRATLLHELGHYFGLSEEELWSI